MEGWYCRKLGITQQPCELFDVGCDVPEAPIFQYDYAEGLVCNEAALTCYEVRLSAHEAFAVQT